jgi:cytochrome c-type biogenesis protein CcmH
VKPFAAVLAILALVFGLAFAFRSHSSKHPSQAAVEAGLVCTTCHEPLNESSSPLAQQMRAFIRTKLRAGWSEKQIDDHFVAELGPQVLATPRTSGFDLLAWLLPFAAIVLGAAAIGVGARAWLANKDGDSEGPVDDGPPLAPSLELRVDQELARFDS